MAKATTRDSERLLSLDVFRGAVILLLIPDTLGGFSFYLMAQRHPDEPVWSLLSAAFSHVKWSGASAWDLVMPAFVFIAGVSMTYSHATRKARGESDSWIFAHAALRAMALLALHLTLSIPVTSAFDYFWPLALLALGSQLPRTLASSISARSGVERNSVELCVWVSVLVLVMARGLLRFHEIPSFDLSGILPSLGLAYFVAYLFVPLPSRIQAAGALGILFLYWLAFALYQPPLNVDPALYGITSSEEIYSGFLSHWSKGTHVAAALDVWLLNLFPRHYPYVPPTYGTHTLRFVPVAATLLLGALVGRDLRSDRPREYIRNRLCFLAVIGVALALMLDQRVEPMVMRIWTSSWTLYSTGLVLILFVGLYTLIDVHGHQKWTTVFVVAGSNSILLYVLAIAYRWPVIAVWRRVFGNSVFDGYWQPVAESLAFALTLWVIAFVLYRLRILIRL